MGADVANKMRSGSGPTPDQAAKIQSSGCFSAMVSGGPPPGSPGGPPSGQPSGAGAPTSQIFSSIPVVPPPQFQADSPAVACAKQIMGGGFGTQPTPDQMSQIQTKCFAAQAPGQQLGFVAPGGEPGRGGPPPGYNQGPPSLPPEIKSCVLKAGMSEAEISAIQRGQSPTADQQQKGESCFKQYAKDKGYTEPTLMPPDPTQPFDPGSKQNQCADLVAQTHGIRFNQINPGVVVSWSAEDVGKLRSCYGVSSLPSNNVAFAPTSAQVAVSSSKLTCIEQAVGKDKLAGVVAGTTAMSDADRKAVYDKCININKVAAGANPALLGVLAAMPPSDLESLFIPVNSQQLPTPLANGSQKANANGTVTVSGEVDVTAGSTLPNKVEVFVKSTPNIMTVSLKKVSATKATWSVDVAQSKLTLGNHQAYAVATLADANQVRSPEAKFSIAAIKAAKGHWALAAEVTVASLAAVVGARYAWKWHKRAHHASHL